MGSSDATSRRPPRVESVPSGIGQVTTGSSIIYPITDVDPTHLPKGSVVFTVTTFPDDQRLGLWERLWNAFIDNDDIAYDYFAGASLSDDQRLKLVVMPNASWAASDDTTNQRVLKVKVLNNDTVPHTIYFKFKTYTFTGVS